MTMTTSDYRALLLSFAEAMAATDALPATTNDEKRWRACSALSTVRGLLDAIAPVRTLGLGVRDLLEAIADGASGNKAGDWLRDKPSGKGQPPLPIRVANLHGRCAGLMELLMDKCGPNKNLEQAAKSVARHLPNTTWKTVARWRERVTGATEYADEKRAYDLQVREGSRDIEKVIPAIVKALLRD